MKEDRAFRILFIIKNSKKADRLRSFAPDFLETPIQSLQRWLNGFKDLV